MLAAEFVERDASSTFDLRRTAGRDALEFLGRCHEPIELITCLGCGKLHNLRAPQHSHSRENRRPRLREMTAQPDHVCGYANQRGGAGATVPPFIQLVAGRP